MMSMKGLCLMKARLKTSEVCVCVYGEGIPRSRGHLSGACKILDPVR
jgi:hypothetical protein